MAIPKIIHQTISDKAMLDDLACSNIAKIKEMNKGWEYRLYEEDDRRELIRNFYGDDMLYCYERIDPLYGAARADLFRYLALYQYGGVYLDVKSTINRPLDHVLQDDDEYILSHWRNKRGEEYEGWGFYKRNGRVLNEYQQWHVISSKGHPFLKHAIERVKTNIDEYNPFTGGVGRKGVVKLTGPIPYTSAIEPIKNLYPHRMVDIQDLGFQYSIYAPTEEHKYGHIGLFRNHYSYRVHPIVARENNDDLWSIVIRMLTGYRMIYRAVRDSIKKMVGRRLD